MQTESLFSLAFEQAERELGQSIGYPALVYDTPDMSMIGTAADYDQAEMLDYEQRRNTRLEEDIQTLRLALAAAREHVGALLTQEAGVLECLEAGDPWPKSSRDSAAEHLRAAHDAARAWLRRSEPAGREA